jgi:hypothetical protein
MEEIELAIGAVVEYPQVRGIFTADNRLNWSHEPRGLDD